MGKGGGRRGREGEPGSWDGLKKSFGKGWRDGKRERGRGRERGRESVGLLGHRVDRLREKERERCAENR